MSYCSKCVTEYDDSKNFCKLCGSKLEQKQHSCQSTQDNHVDSDKICLTTVAEEAIISPEYELEKVINNESSNSIDPMPNTSNFQTISFEDTSITLDSSTTIDNANLCVSDDNNLYNKAEQLHKVAICDDELIGHEHNSPKHKNIAEIKLPEVAPPVIQVIGPNPIPEDASALLSVANPDYDSVSFHCPDTKEVSEPLKAPTEKPVGFGQSPFRKLSIIVIASVCLIISGYWGYVWFAEDNNRPLISTKHTGSLGTTIPQQKNAPSLPNTPNEEVRHVFETLKQANLSKNIDLFMTCYSPKYTSLENKKSTILANWQKYNYTKLNYDIKGFNFYKDEATGIVDWQITAYSRETGKSISMDTAFNVVMQKENGIWRIVSLEKK